MCLRSMTENNAFVSKYICALKRNFPLKGILILLLYLISIPQVVHAQKSKAQLEKEKKQTQRKIAETNKILQETATERQATIGQLTAINEQISSRTELINSINREMRLLDQEMGELSQITFSMENDLANLRKEYASMVYAASKVSSGYNKLVFLFSSATFTQLFMRLKYLQQYSEARKIQVNQIQKIKNILIAQRSEMNQKKQEKNALLQIQVSENNNLLALKEKQNQIIQQLNSRQKELEEEIAESKKAIGRLDKLITDLIEEEIKKTTKSSEGTAIALTPEETSVANSFEESKSKLIWPVKAGFISSKFGIQPHPVVKGTVFDNKGISIQTNKGESVRAVYDGVVLSVATVPGMNKLVALQHGDYITVYAKLSKVTVKAGQKVKAKDVIGEVYTAKDGTSELQFQIWKNYERLNPQAWLFEK